MPARLTALPLLVFALVLSIGGAVLMVLELRPFAFSYASREDLLDRIAETAPPIPPSIHGTAISMDVCVSALNDLGLRLGPTSRRQGVADTCAQAARKALAMMPAYSYGHYVSALADFRRGDHDRAAASLILSQGYGANAQWIAQLRVALAEDYYDALGVYAAQGHVADLALLAQSERGVHALAARYLANPDFRERITAVVETLPLQAQRRFAVVVGDQARLAGVQG